MTLPFRIGLRQYNQRSYMSMTLFSLKLVNSANDIAHWQSQYHVRNTLVFSASLIGTLQYIFCNILDLNAQKCGMIKPFIHLYIINSSKQTKRNTFSGASKYVILNSCVLRSTYFFVKLLHC